MGWTRVAKCSGPCLFLTVLLVSLLEPSQYTLLNSWSTGCTVVVHPILGMSLLVD